MTGLLRTAKVLIVVFGVTLLSSCATVREPLDPEMTPPEVLYNQALDLLIKDQEYTRAIKAFDEIDRYYPYSRWAVRAQIMLAFTHYMKKQYDDSIMVLDRFIQLYPGNRYTPYAYYLKALCYYDQISDVRRDQKMTELALEALEEVRKRFPKSDYARDAAVKIELARDHLAGKEMTVGRFYLHQNAHLAAMNRFITVVKKYQTTDHVQEALYRLTETYLILGLNEEAQKSAAVLGYNYPSSRWYKKAYELMKKKNAVPAGQEKKPEPVEQEKK